MNRFFEKDGIKFDIDTIKANLKTLNNADLAYTLNKTDWYVVRAVDVTSNKDIPQSVIDARTAARKQCVNVENEINNATTIKELEQVYNSYL